MREKASLTSRRSIDENGVVRSRATMNCTTPSSTHTRHIVPSTAWRRRNSSENTSEVSTIIALHANTSGEPNTKPNSRGTEKPRLHSSTNSVSTNAKITSVIARWRKFASS